jgi:Malectin domain
MAQTLPEYAEERNELQAVLDSGIFNRAPNLAHLLTYVCARYFEGEGEQIKEYNIAVEALGRLSGFDPKRDSIVRVEAHRLRKRLRDYYEAEGADHGVRIEIPAGQYAPQFMRSALRQPSLADQAAVAPDHQAGLEMAAPVAVGEQVQLQRAMPLLAPPPPGAPPLLRAPRPGGLVWAGVALVLLTLSGALAWKLAWTRPSKGAGAGAIAAVPPGPEVRILAGLEGGTYTDRFGHTWQSDRYFQGGTAFDATDHPIIGARDPRLFRSRREGALSYDIPLPPGVYEMRLYFAETLYGENNVAGGGESSRIFRVSANNTDLLDDFDVTSEAGASVADVRAFKDISPAADGKLHLRFVPITGLAMVSGIEITPGTPGRLRPIRMVSRDHPYTDKEGRTWEPDFYSRGGQLVMRPGMVTNIEDPDLLKGERFGNLSYVISVPPGRYGVTLYFAETWFGPANFAGGGAGSRMFDILCNGVALRRGFDIFKEAGGGGRALALPVHGMEPNPQGKLNMNLTPVRNYASLNALEVVDESR